MELSRCERHLVGALKLRVELLIREEQQRAELEAKMCILKQEQELKEAEFKLQMQRESFELQAKLEVANAKVKVYEQLSDIHSQCGDDKGTVSYDGTKPKRAVSVNVQQTAPRTAPTASRDQPSTVEEHHARPDAHSDNTRESEAHVMSETVASMARLLKKPSIDMKKFSGDFTEFRRFQRHFKSKIEPICDDDEGKMTYLEQLTEGEPHEIVCGYSHLSPCVAFSAATEELVKRYGDEQSIADTYVQKVLNWPQIKTNDVKSLDKYSILLSECSHAISDLSALSVLESSENMKLVVNRLPYQLHER